MQSEINSDLEISGESIPVVKVNAKKKRKESNPQVEKVGLSRDKSKSSIQEEPSKPVIKD